ncbi:MAG: hypothetical protein KKA97_11435 [Actinobacteria bacterium]|nr:hypothetical protein [Actinomycetota bacterium]
MRSLLRGTIAAVALTLAPVAVVTTSSAPAHAAAEVATTSSFSDSITKRGEFGRFFSVSGGVDAADESFIDAGEARLQVQKPGSSTWKTIEVASGVGFASFPDYDKYRSNVKLRIAYTGGTSDDTTYLPSVSKAISIKVLRSVDFSSVSGKRQPTADVKVKPKFGKKKLLIQKKKGKKFKTFKKVKTNKKGKARFSVPGSSKGIKYLLVVPKDKNFVATKIPFTATRF